MKKVPTPASKRDFFQIQKLAIQPVVVCILARKGVLWTLLLP
jgi:hypothetical protein